MSQYYNSKRTRGLYDAKSKEPFKLSRSKIDLFFECPRCFYLDRVKGTGRPPGYPFTLNSAVDTLLKKEFDIHRKKCQPHPLMKAHKVDAIPFQHKDLENWRNNFKGIQYLHKPTNFLIFGAIDDVWINKKKELIIVDYKSTATDKEITLNEKWKDGYKRQMEVYQWLFRQNGFKVCTTGYFVYVNGRTDIKAFDAKLEFDVNLLPYNGKDGWIEVVLSAIYKCLRSKKIPQANPQCDYCAYINAITK